MKEKKRVIFLQGQKTILRPLSKETDLEACLRWINDPEIRQFLSVYMSMTLTEEENWFERLDYREDAITLAMETLDGEFIGVMSLVDINWKNRTATSGAFIGEKEFWGQGYGTDAKMILLDYAFNTLNLRKICSSVWQFNKRSLQYNLHSGYQIEGCRKKQIFKNGRYWDEIILAVFKKDWQPIWSRYKKTGSIR